MYAKRMFLLFTALLAGASWGAWACNDDDQPGGADAETSADVEDDTSPVLMWQDPADSDRMDWQSAIDYCDELVFDGYEDWRLPGVGELRSLIHGCPNTEVGGACGVDNSCTAMGCGSDVCWDACEAGPDICYIDPTLTGPCGWYWSASTVEGMSSSAWRVSFYTGGINLWNLIASNYVRCVR